MSDPHPLRSVCLQCAPIDPSSGGPPQQAMMTDDELLDGIRALGQKFMEATANYNPTFEVAVCALLDVLAYWLARASPHRTEEEDALIQRTPKLLYEVIAHYREQLYGKNAAPLQNSPENLQES